MFCQNCGTDVVGAFCPKCGRQVAQQAAQPVQTQPVAPQFNPQTSFQPVTPAFNNGPLQNAGVVANEKTKPFVMLINAGVTVLKILTLVLFFFETVILEIDLFYTETEYYTYLDFTGRDDVMIFSIVFIFFAFLGIVGSILGLASRKLSIVSTAITVVTSVINLASFLIPYFILTDELTYSDYLTLNLSFFGVLVIIMPIVSALGSVVSAAINKTGKLI